MIKMAEIAEIANVSVATVSLALNGKKGVGEKTRKHIIAIAEERGYKMAKKKNSDKEHLLNIVFIVAFNNKVLNENFRTQPFFSSLIDIIINYSQNDSINFSIASVNSDSLIDEIDTISTNNNYDGVIVLSTNLTNNSVDICIKETKIPIVFLDCVHSTAEGNIVGINNTQGVHLAVKHIVEKGHKNIGYVMSDVRIRNFEERFEAFKESTSSFNLNFNEENIITLSPNQIDAQENIKTQLNKLDSIPTVFFCENDTLAISFIKSLTKLGYDVPKDISIIGFDNIRESTVITPELSTVSVDQNHFVATAIEQLMFSIENSSKVRHTYINCSLIARDSVADK